MGTLSGRLALLLLLPASAQPAAAPPRQAPARVTLSAVGDIRLDGPVGELIARRGAAYPLSGLGDLLDADISFGNLECSVTRRGQKQPKTWNFRAPPRSLAALQDDFDILNLANNHSMDYGVDGFLDTLAALRQHGLAYVGGGKDLREAESLRVIEEGGLRVGFLAFTSTFPKSAWARKARPGVAYSDFDRFPAVVAAARRDCDVLVVSFHGGTELAAEPNEIQKDFAHLAVDSGADLVLGHHPHVLQAVEVYKGKPILYSLGNFLFVSPTPETRYTAVAFATLTPEGVSRIEFAPLDIAWGRPVPAGEEGRKAVREALDRLGALSAHPELLGLSP